MKGIVYSQSESINSAYITEPSVVYIASNEEGISQKVQGMHCIAIIILYWNVILHYSILEWIWE